MGRIVSLQNSYVEVLTLVLHNMTVQRRPFRGKDVKMQTQREGGPLQTKETGLGGNQTYRHLDLGLSASKPVRKWIYFNSPTLWNFVMAALAK